MFSFLLSILVFLSSNSYAQEVDFDKNFPLSENDLYYPLIGENGELPSEREGAYAQPYNAKPTSNINDDDLRFEQENIEALKEAQKDVYQEPTAVGYQPMPTEQKNIDVKNEQPAVGSKSFSMEDLKHTKASETSILTEADVAKAEEAVVKMEQTIESLIGSHQEETTPKKAIDEAKASPLINFPNLTEKTIDDVTSYGLYTLKTGGFAPNIWESIDRVQADKFFKKIRLNKILSPALSEEIVKLLLTSATPPQGESHENWLAERASMLQTLGEASRAGLLISSAGIHVKNVNSYKNMGQVWVENGLMHGNDQEICPFVRQNILNTDNPFWHRALLVCQLLARDLKGLELSTNMLTEKMRRTDPLLFSLLDTIQGQEAAPILRPEQTLNPLHSVIYAESPILLTPNVIPLLPDAVLRRVAKNVTLPLTVRIQSAETLVNKFNESDDIALLGLLYNKVEFDKKIVTSPGIERYAEEEVDGSLARALLWQGSKISGLPSTRALTLKALWERADRDKLFRLASRITPHLRNISSDANLAWLAPEVINRALKFGDISTAKKWWKTLKANHSLSRELMKSRDNLEILFAFVDGELNNNAFETWISNKSLFDEKDRADIQKLLTFFEASEIDFPQNIWEKLQNTMDDAFVNHGKDVSPLWLRLLGMKLEEQDVVASLMLLTDPLLQSTMGEMSEQTAGNIITGFRFLGMEKTANSLIFEALITRK